MSVFKKPGTGRRAPGLTAHPYHWLQNYKLFFVEYYWQNDPYMAWRCISHLYYERTHQLEFLCTLEFVYNYFIILKGQFGGIVFSEAIQVFA